jgi:hypothetical protein
VSRAQQLTAAALVPAALALGAAACGDARLYVYDKPGPPPNCPPTMVGYAAVGGMDPNGNPLEPTTGGGDPSVAPRITVTTVDELTSALQQPDPLVIYLDGMLSPPAAVKVTVDKSAPGGNKTLIGVGAGSGLTTTCSATSRRGRACAGGRPTCSATTSRPWESSASPRRAWRRCWSITTCSKT